MGKSKTVEELREGLNDPSRSPAALKQLRCRIKRIEEGRCGYCGKEFSGDGLRACAECRVKYGHGDPKYSTAWRKQKEREGKCTHCGIEQAAAGRKLCVTCKEYFRSKAAENYKRNPEKWRACTKSGLQKLRMEVFNSYGGPICNCCGEAIFEFLTMDHVENNGAKHRQELFGRRTGGRQFYMWLKRKKFPPGYQVFCMNCNWGKHVNGGICPHKQLAA